MSSYEQLGLSFSQIVEEDLFPSWDVGWEPVRPHVKVRRPVDFDQTDLGVFLCRGTEKDKSWQTIFSDNPQIKYIVAERVNQALFDAICAMPNLERLDLGAYRLAAAEIDAIAKLRKLTHLSLYNAAKVESFACLAGLKNLKSLGISGKYRNPLDLSFLKSLSALEGLWLHGQDYHKQSIVSLTPLTALTHLRYLSLFQIKTTKSGLHPVAELGSLEYLFLAPDSLKQWSREEYKAIYEGCPKLKGTAVKLAATDPDFRKKNRIK